ncbi:putative capsular polysaccharide biosynthesis protein [Listeria weihenstephanensis FSL R9-0317]|uniref:CpsD/CapB family tyrosine-protein kinase n=1 Tax=Listeria weihenstephanensis TaxID=1006155 RepID=UPI0003E85850|nr:CpsD/CapB family tyrosine-protein kinase [Listeria weihenstephanensis]EUJ39835.1 putative capsular polysaccharide biosynthesis protein [Listeria weihenstephanensis FSL R9-0317]
MQKERSKLLIKHQKGSKIAEQFRMIRTNIEFISKKRALKTIMITSTKPQEGKSTIIANLADVMGRQNMNVLIIDADLRLPSQHYILGVDNAVGLTDILEETLAVNAVIQKTTLHNVDIISAGQSPNNPSELLSKPALTELFETVKEHYDYILVDAPPVIVADTTIVAQEIDGIIMVAEENKTPKQKFQKAMTTLKSTHTPIIGIILNKTKQDKGSKYYYYNK